MKTVLHALNSVEAHVVKGLLQSEGIECSVLGEYLQGAIGELPPTGLIRVVVNDEDYEQASAIIDDWSNAGLLA